MGYIAKVNAVSLNYPVLAMAHHRLGNHEEARRWLERAHWEKGDAARGGKPGKMVGSSVPWWDRVEFQLLLHEAEALVVDEAFPTDLTAP